MFVWGGEYANPKWMNHDAANALYIGGRLLRGDVLYVDWYYFVAPPIVLWSEFRRANAFAHWLCRRLGLATGLE